MEVRFGKKMRDRRDEELDERVARLRKEGGGGKHDVNRFDRYIYVSY